MRLLLIHTAGNEGSVALADTKIAPAVVASEVLPGRSSSERLVPAINWLMKDQGWRLSELAALVVVYGPGSFTGVRVGVSAAKGLSEAAGVPMIAISRLALLATRGACGRAHAVLDAGRGEFYYGEYVAGRCVRELLISHQEVVAATAGDGVVVVCETRVAEALAELKICVVGEPMAADALPIALERIAAGDFADASLLDANYLRRTDAEIFMKPAVPRDTQ